MAAEAAGFVTVGQCEWADYPTKVLEMHWPDVPRWQDIQTLTGEDFHGRTGLRTVDVISGGFPCQPFSVAGKQKGRDDHRYLWPEMLRVIREIAPGWIIGENVPGIMRIAAGDVVEDLEREGYDVAVFDFEAAAVGALHRRERIAFVANRAGNRKLGLPIQSQNQRKTKDIDINGRGENVAHPCGKGLQRCEQHGSSDAGQLKQEPYGPAGECRQIVPDAKSPECTRGRAASRNRRPVIGLRGWWSAEPDVGRVADGVPNRVDRIKALGNAVVPQQFYPIFKAIAEVEREERRRAVEDPSTPLRSAQDDRRAAAFRSRRQEG